MKKIVSLFILSIMICCLFACGSKNNMNINNEDDADINIMQGKWYSSTFIVDGKIITLKDYYDLMVENDTTNQDFIGWPMMTISNTNVHFDFMSMTDDYLLVNNSDGIFAVEKDTKDINNGIKMMYDDDLDYIYTKSVSDTGETICEVYGRIPDNYVDLLNDKIQGAWAFAEREIDGKVVDGFEFNNYYSGLQNIEEKKYGYAVNVTYNKDNTLEAKIKRKTICKTNWTIGDEGFYIHNSKDFDGCTYSYDDYYDVLRLMPKKSGENLTAILMRSKEYNTDVLDENKLAGTWKMDFSTHGAEFNNDLEYEKIEKYFGYSLYEDVESEFVFFEDGTGRFNNKSKNTSEEIIYEINDENIIKITYPNDNNYIEILKYGRGIDAIVYENGHNFVESDYAIYRKE